MQRLLLGLVAAFAYAGLATAQDTADHLECFKVKDAQPKTLYTADLSGLVAQSGCTVKYPATMACVPTAKSNVQPAPPGGGGTGVPNSFACYKLKCPKGALPSIQLDDQFGSRSATTVKSKLLCAPIVGTANACFEPFEPVLAQFLNAFVFGLGSDDSFDITPSCGGDVEVCCAGGTPTASCGPIRFEITAASVTDNVGANRVDLSVTVHAATVEDIPFRSFGLDCAMRIDTAPGTSPTIQLVFGLQMNADYSRIVGVGDVTITGFADDDVEIVGGFACQAANFSTDFFLDTLRDMLAEKLRDASFGCRVCDSNAVAACPP